MGEVEMTLKEENRSPVLMMNVKFLIANADKCQVHIQPLIVMNSRSTMRTEGGSLRVEVSPNLAKPIVITCVGHVFNSSWIFGVFGHGVYIYIWL
jgi:hypothetical protein